MISIWILISIIGVASLVFGIPKFFNGESLGFFCVFLGMVATSIGGGMVWSLCV